MYGCYSFQAVSDLGTLKKYRKISDGDEGFQNISMEDYLTQLKPEDKSAILKVKATFGGKANDELTRLTYLSYPYYAINSMLAERILTSEEFDKVKRTRPIKRKSVLFTIGYEGKTVESYLNSLIINDIRVLCDVRNNPISMKFGFSKTQLQKFCEALGIKYVHLPAVGIQSEKRQQLHSQTDYNELFKEYKATTLQNTSQIQSYILSLLSDNERIALTCFEANVCQCHRKPLAEAIAALPGWHFELSHI